MLLGSHATQKTLTLFLLDLLSSQLALLGLLFLLDTAQLLDFILTNIANLAQDLATEVGSCDKLVSKAQELVEEGDSSGIAGGGGKIDRELNTLLGNGLINPERDIS